MQVVAKLPLRCPAIVEKWRDANGIVWYKQLVQTTIGQRQEVKSPDAGPN